MAIYTPEKLQPGRMMPDFTLPIRGGGPLRISDFRQRANLVILFTRLKGGQEVQNIFARLSELVPGLEGESTEVLAVFPGDASFPSSPLTGVENQVTILLDQSGGILDRFLAPGLDGAVFILDRFSEIYAVEDFTVGDQQFSPGEILGTVQFIGLQCPE